MPSLPSDPLVPERRTQARVLVEIPITVAVQGRAEPLHGQTLNLSWGGLLFMLPESLPKANLVLQIGLPAGAGRSITAEAQVLRNTPLPDGRTLIAARFTSLLPQEHKRLERLLRLLLKGGAAGGRFAPDELVRTLVVNANDSQELRHMLEEIATGRHQLTVFESYAVDQSIAFRVAGTNEDEEIALRARVVEVSDSAIAGAEWAHLHDITVEFEHPLDAIQALIQHASRVTLPAGASADAAPSTPDAGVPLVSPESSSPLTSGQPCAIEEQFPALMDTLSSVWHDPDAFSQLLQALLVGNLSQPGSWPRDVWEELILLQAVHDERFRSVQQVTPT